MTRSVIVPSIYKDGVHSLSFTRVEKESTEARASFDISSLMSLQHVFDMHCDMDITQNESDEDRLIVTAVYILAIRTGVDYYDKSVSTMPEMHERMATVMEDHEKALRVAGIDVQAIDQFIRGCGVMASTICVTTFKVNPQYMGDARRQLAMSGLAAILRTHIKRDQGVYLGVEIVDDSKRELRMLSAYTRLSSRGIPCCDNPHPEKGRAGRCASRADKGFCDHRCPVACGLCRICPGMDSLQF